MFSNTCAMTLAQKSDRILAQTRGLSGATPNATQLIEELRWALEENRREVERLTTERDRARRLVCELQCDPPERFIGLPHEVAQMYDWKCFGEQEDHSER